MTTSERKPFTGITWDSINSMFTPRSGLDWTHLSDLEHELADRVPHLSYEELRLLMGYTSSGLPLIITWDNRMGESRVERVRAACVVQYVVAPGVNDVAHTGYIRVSYPGFTHDVHFSRVRKIEQFKTEATFLDADQA